MKFTYLAINLGSILIPFVFSFHPKLRFHQQWKAFWPANLITLLLFVGWDTIYTHLGVWGFNEAYLTGLPFFNLPLEEVLFFICIPYASVFTYHCLNLLIRKDHFAGISRFITPVLIAGSLLVVILNFGRLYTAAVFAGLALMTSLALLAVRFFKLSRFYFSYLILMIPFIIVNGLLTGTGLDEPVVWYNDQENLGIRILTIPVEDGFYGMLLLMLNTMLYEWFRKRFLR